MTMIFAVMYREFRIRTTSFTWTFFDLFMPLMYLLVFGLGLDSAFSSGIQHGGRVYAYNEFFLAGVLALACFGIAINTSYGFFVDRDNGIFYEFLTYPMTRGEFLIGKIVFNCLLSLVQSVITIGLGILLLDIRIAWATAMFIPLAIVLGTAGWFFFLTIFALRIRRNDMFNTFINIVYFVLMFASSIFYPVDGMPMWLRILADVNPLTWLTDILRFASTGSGSPDTIILQSVAFLLFLGASLWVAVRTMKRPVLT